MDLGIKGKVALVTGGASGIGKAITEELLKNGAKVYITSRSESRLKECFDSLGKLSSNLITIKSDLTNGDEPENLIKKILVNDEVDILVNNIGDTLGITDPYCKIEDWHKLFNLIMGVAIRLNNAVIPYMSQKKWGRIVNITAGAAYENSGPVPTVLQSSFYSLFKING